jgi:hypothetical protein
MLLMRLNNVYATAFGVNRYPGSAMARAVAVAVVERCVSKDRRRGKGSVFEKGGKSDSQLGRRKLDHA